MFSSSCMSGKVHKTARSEPFCPKPFLNQVSEKISIAEVK
jgi:hypothetical protein